MGLASRKAINIAINVRYLSMLLAPWPNPFIQPSLPVMTADPSNISAVLVQIDLFTNSFKVRTDSVPTRHNIRHAYTEWPHTSPPWLYVATTTILHGPTVPPSAC